MDAVRMTVATQKYCSTTDNRLLQDRIETDRFGQKEEPRAQTSPHEYFSSGLKSPIAASARKAEIQPEDYIDRAKEFLHSGRHVEAWNVMNDAVGLYGGAKTLSWRGAIGRIIGHETAKSDLDEAIRLNPSGAFSVLNRLLMGIDHLDTFEETCNTLQNILNKDPENQFALICWAAWQRFFHRGDPASTLRTLLRVNPNHDIGWAMLAQIDNESFNKRLDYLCSSLEINPFNELAHYQLMCHRYPGKSRRFESFKPDCIRCETIRKVLSSTPLWLYGEDNGCFKEL